MLSPILSEVFSGAPKLGPADAAALAAPPTLAPHLRPASSTAGALDVAALLQAVAISPTAIPNAPIRPILAW